MLMLLKHFTKFLVSLSFVCTAQKEKKIKRKKSKWNALIVYCLFVDDIMISFFTIFTDDRRPRRSNELYGRALHFYWLTFEANEISIFSEFESSVAWHLWCHVLVSIFEKWKRKRNKTTWRSVRNNRILVVGVACPKPVDHRRESLTRPIASAHSFNGYRSHCVELQMNWRQTTIQLPFFPFSSSRMNGVGCETTTTCCFVHRPLSGSSSPNTNRHQLWAEPLEFLFKE